MRCKLHSKQYCGWCVTAVCRLLFQIKWPPLAEQATTSPRRLGQHRLFLYLQSCFHYGSQKAENLTCGVGKEKRGKEHALEDGTFDTKASCIIIGWQFRWIELFILSLRRPLPRPLPYLLNISILAKNRIVAVITRRLYAHSTDPQRRCRGPSGQHTIIQYQLKNSPNMTCPVGDNTWCWYQRPKSGRTGRPSLA
ncbi:hypothetical protein PoB_000696800 [Plakobranchus ocellatus]|uniref:Uncharacterized protein n=1 Tax=Plakobranchus ocellatus TaxID=259542 RepID=A0AAV3YD96_9GAST|nr:hypothetical protein PoB_000696800 [Plakobranchus ocellatus]